MEKEGLRCKLSSFIPNFNNTILSIFLSLPTNFLLLFIPFCLFPSFSPTSKGKKGKREINCLLSSSPSFWPIDDGLSLSIVVDPLSSENPPHSLREPTRKRKDSLRTISNSLWFWSQEANSTLSLVILIEISFTICCSVV